MNPSIERAIELAGGTPADLGRLVGESPQTVSNWRRRGRIPPEKSPKVESALGGRVLCENLCPEVDWSYLRGTKQVSLGETVPSPDTLRRQAA